MKRFLIILIIVVIAVGGGFLFIRSRNSGSRTVFRTSPVSRGSIQSVVTATGELTAVTAVDVGSEVSGVIDKIFVEHNSTVKKGQILAQINPETLQAQVDKAEASLARSRSSYDSAVSDADNSRAAVKKAEASLLSQQAQAKKSQAEVENARAGLANSQANLHTAKANLAKSEAEYANAKANYERWNKLFDQDLVSRSERDDAYTSMVTSKASVDASKANLEAAAASVRSAEISLQSAMISFEGAQADVEAARIQVEATRNAAASSEAAVAGAAADVKQAEASLNSAKVDLSKTSITSPIDGIVLSIEVSEGQTVASQYQTPELFKLAQNLDSMQVEATVDEADIGQINVGDSASFTVDAWPNKIFEGKVQEVRKAAETTNNVVTFPVIISTNNPDMCLIPGMTATVSIQTIKHNDILLVPSASLRFKPSDAVEIVNSDDHVKDKSKAEASGGVDAVAVDKKAVRALYIEDKNNPSQLVRIEVTTGLTDGTNTEVESSELKEGDRVVIGSADKSLIKSSSSNKRRGGPPF
ncbi:MAG: efflux RND transporter periplasmic adaptor subunit [Candidatus Bruticola sp.]